MKFHNTITAFRNRLANLENVKLTKDDVDKFYDEINSFNFRFSLFGKYYQNYIDNINRFKPEEDNYFDITFLKIAIAEDKWKPTKPLDIFKHHIRYKYKLTSKLFISRQKKQNLKKLNTPDVLTKEVSKFDASKKWTKIPIRQDQCKPDCGCSK